MHQTDGSVNLETPVIPTLNAADSSVSYNARKKGKIICGRQRFAVLRTGASAFSAIPGLLCRKMIKSVRQISMKLMPPIKTYTKARNKKAYAQTVRLLTDAIGVCS